MTTTAPAIDEDTARARVLAAADALFNARGIQSVGMDALRAEAGVSLKRLYALFPSKEALVEAVLRHRQQVWLDGLASAAQDAESARERLLTIFDFLAEWFAQDDFRGCAFINSFGELGGTNESLAQIVRDQKAGFQRYVAQLVSEAGAPAWLAPQLAILAEGAQTTAAICGDRQAAADARRAAETLIAAAT
jgi:AcrR family transcriptional regulator